LLARQSNKAQSECVPIAERFPRERESDEIIVVEGKDGQTGRGMTGMVSLMVGGVRKDSENSRRHSSAPQACKFARIDSEGGKQEEKVEREIKTVRERKRGRSSSVEGKRGRRVKYLTDTATKRPEQTTNKQTKTSILRLYGACSHEARTASRFSNSPTCPTLLLREMGRKAEGRSASLASFVP